MSLFKRGSSSLYLLIKKGRHELPAPANTQRDKSEADSVHSSCDIDSSLLQVVSIALCIQIGDRLTVVVHEGHEVRVLDGSGAGLFQAGHDGIINAQRSGHTALGVVGDVVALLLTGRNIGEDGVALFVHDAQADQVTGLDEAASFGQRDGNALNEAAGCVLDSGSSAFLIGDHLDVDAGSALLFRKAYVGYFSWFFLLIFSFSCTFVLGLVDGTFINLLGFLWVMACLRGGLIPDPAALYGESFVRRFPFLYICILGVAYIIMFSIQRYWVDKAKRHLLLQQRIDAEKGKLSEMSLKVITAMYSALSSKIPEIDLHCQQTAELTQEMARRMGLDEAACRDGYYAGLLHEVGTVGLPDDVVLQRNITEEQYQLYKTYVERGCRIIQELQIVDRVAETVRYHRENYDGTGYLEGLQGEAIPLLSRILAVADFTDRHRRRGETDAQIAAALRECAGHAFDPACVGAMCKMLTEQSAARPQE